MNKDRLYELLPAVYRLRDLEQGGALKALLQVISEQVNLVEEDIARLYENWFIETCEDWVIPYIGDLIDYKSVNEVGQTTPQTQKRDKILSARREVANTIRYRRRKGTLALLEELAQAVAQWPSRAVEFYRLLGWTQHLDHQRPSRGRTADLRQGKSLDQLNTPFNRIAHTVDIRRIDSVRAVGQYNLPSVGLFVWRLKTYSVTHTPAYCFEEEGPQCYTFSVLGNDSPLYNHPQATADGELALPTPITRRSLEEKRHPSTSGSSRASEHYYGASGSLQVWAPNWDGTSAGEYVPAAAVIPADLSHWRYRPPNNHIAIDPVLGRIVFPPRQLPKKGVFVSYNYGFSDDIGGGEYERHSGQTADYHVGNEPGQFSTISAALVAWKTDNPPRSVIEITCSGIYTEPLRIVLDRDQFLEIRAANNTRPVIRLLDYRADSTDSLNISGEEGSSLILNALLVTGRGVQVEGSMHKFTLRHCTLVPGWGLHCDCEPRRSAEPSLELAVSRTQVIIEKSIIGSIQVSLDPSLNEPLLITMNDSILDATDSELEALSEGSCGIAQAVLTIRRSTIIGTVHTHAIDLAENSIFLGRITVARRQRGCVRFCYVVPGSRTPRRYSCQPDLVETKIAELGVQEELSAEQTQAAIEQERQRIRPRFDSIRYGTPTYCRLSDYCATEIVSGADDESEMGVFHELYQPQRVANLRARLNEYTPAGTEVGIIYAT
jgi:hypothetical protein